MENPLKYTDMTETIKLNDAELEVEFNYYKGKPERRYMSNGDPGYPEESPEIDILKVTWNNLDITKLIQELNDSLYEEIESLILKNQERYYDYD